MVVLQHDHAAQVHAVRVGPAHQHAVLLHEPEPGRRLPRPGQDPLVPRAPQAQQQVPADGGDARAAREQVQPHPLAEQQAARRPRHRRYLRLAGSVFRPVDVAALDGVPLDGAPALLEYLVEEWDPCYDSGALAPQRRGPLVLAYHKARIVVRRRVFGEPGGDLGLPAGG